MIRKHQGIIQNGGNKGKLKKGYYYTGIRLSGGISEIKKINNKPGKVTDENKIQFLLQKWNIIKSKIIGENKNYVSKEKLEQDYIDKYVNNKSIVYDFIFNTRNITKRSTPNVIWNHGNYNNHTKFAAGITGIHVYWLNNDNLGKILGIVKT